MRLNKRLDTLSLAGNFIKNIDLTNNTKLIKVDLNTNEWNSVIGLEKALGLNWLSLSKNLLEEFSIHNTSLETLYIKDNLLKNLVVDNALNLKTIFAQINKIETIDLSSNVLIENLGLSDNKINHINLDQNTNIKILYLSSNLLLDFDVSMLQDLYYLVIDRNPNLSCIKIHNNQNISNLTKSDYQELNTACN